MPRLPLLPKLQMNAVSGLKRSVVHLLQRRATNQPQWPLSLILILFLLMRHWDQCLYLRCVEAASGIIIRDLEVGRIAKRAIVDAVGAHAGHRLAIRAVAHAAGKDAIDNTKAALGTEEAAAAASAIVALATAGAAAVAASATAVAVVAAEAIAQVAAAADVSAEATVTAAVKAARAKPMQEGTGSQPAGATGAAVTSITSERSKAAATTIDAGTILTTAEPIGTISLQHPYYFLRST